MLRNDRDGDGVDSDPNTYANAYAHIYTDTSSISYPDGHTYAHIYTDTSSISYPDGHTYADSHTDCYTYADGHTCADGHTYADSHTDCPCQCYTDAVHWKMFTDAEAASDSGAASHATCSHS